MDPQGILDDQAPAVPQNIVAISLAGPLQQWMLPHLTADALAALAISCKALHQLITSAPASLLQPNLRTLLPPAIRHRAVGKRSLDALLAMQAAFQQAMQAGAPAQLQRLTLPDSQHAHNPRWALTSPCKMIIVDCAYPEFDHRPGHQMVVDPCSLRCSHQHPAAEWSKPHSRCWYFQGFLREGAFVKYGDQYGLLDLERLELAGIWESPLPYVGCRTWMGAGLVFHEHAKVRSVHHWNHSVVSLIALEPASMQERYVIGPPSQQPSEAAPDASAFWIGLSPNQEHLAILWFEDSTVHFCSTRYLNLCIYEACTGQQVAAFDVAAIFDDLNCRRKPTSVVQWSSDSSCVLYQEDHVAGILQDKALRVMAAKVSGCFWVMTSLPNLDAQAVSWSPDGRWVSISSFSGKGSQGSAWHIPTGQKAFAWESADGACLPIWAPSGRIIFCPGSRSLVSLSAKGCKAIHQPYYGPHLLQKDPLPPFGPSITFSPSGRVFVAAWRVQPARLFDAHAAALDEELPRELGHVVCDLTAPACEMVPVATSSSGWVMGSITWHPGPWSTHIYAITTASGSVYLMDAKQHRCIRKWSRSELARPSSSSLDAPLQLSWSPDGTQLLVLGAGCICMLSFANEPSSILSANA